MKKILWLLFFIFLFAFTWYNEVPNDLTEEDKVALTKYGKFNNTEKLTNLQKADVLLDQLRLLIRKDYAIPKGSSREPKDLMRYRTGAGYDWARTAYKFFLFHDIQCRQVSLYQMDGSFFQLFNPDLASFAGLEVHQDGKWIFVDPTTGWMSIKKDGSLGETKEMMDLSIKWKSALGPDLHGFRKKAFKPVYGLYSRHGQFYPPFTPIPDYNFSEFKLNF